jgi:hypothetical protein
MKQGMSYDEYIKSDWYLKHVEKLAARKYGPKAPVTKPGQDKHIQKLRLEKRKTWLKHNK